MTDTLTVPTPYRGFTGDPRNNQEVFDFVALHLLRQGCQAREVTASGRGWCRFRTVQDGCCLMCAAGCLIPDADYQKEWEAESTIETEGDKPATRYFRDRGFHLELLGCLQGVHDNDGPDVWRRELRSVAKHFKLSDQLVLKGV